MMRYTILMFTLLHYSWGDGIYGEIRKHLENLKKQHEHFTFDKTTLHVPKRTMTKNPCGCETVFLKELKKVLENVKPKAKDSNRKYEEILSKLLANLKLAKIQEENPSKEEHACKMEPSYNDDQFFLRNINLIRRRTERC